MVISANGLFGIGFDTTAKTVTVYGMRANASFVSIYNNTTKKHLLGSGAVGGVSSILPGRIVMTFTDLTGMSNTDDIRVNIDIVDSELNAYLTGRLVGRTEKDVSPSDTVDLPGGPGFIVVRGTAGNVVVVTLMGDTVTWAMDSKEVSLIMVRRVKATSTTATSIKVIY